MAFREQRRKDIIAENLITQSVNLGLVTLGNLIKDVQSQSSHASYRGSKLTYLLQGSFGPASRSVMFVNLSPSPSAVTDSINACKFGMALCNAASKTSKKTR